MSLKSGKRLRSPVIIGECEVIIEGKPVRYLLKRSPRAKHLWLRVSRDRGLVVTVPRGYDVARLPAFLTIHRRWISGALERYCHPQNDPPVIESVPYLGKYF